MTSHYAGTEQEKKKNLKLGSYLLYLFIRLPRTVVPTVLCFVRDVFLFLSRRFLQGPSTDRSETLPHDRKVGALCDPSPKKIAGGAQHIDYTLFIAVKPIFGAGAVFRDTVMSLAVVV